MTRFGRFWAKWGDLVVILLICFIILSCTACSAKAPSSSLDALKEKQRHQLYTRCMAENRHQMQDSWILMQAGVNVSPFAIHDACRNWARKVVK